MYRWLWPVLAGEDGPYDIIFAGNSHFMDGVDPRQIAAIAGQSAFNLASYNVTSLDMAELILDFGLRPSVVVVEVCPSYCLYRGPAVTRSLVQPPVARRQRLEPVLADHLEWLFPFLFAPPRFRPVVQRCWQSLKEYRRTRLISLKRYTPFRPLVSVEWSLEKRTNHRIVRRRRPKTHWEQAAENVNLQRVKADMAKACPLTTAAYQHSLNAARCILAQLQQRGIRVVLCRMPLDPDISAYEDAHFSAYYRDIQQIAQKLQLEFVDLSTSQHREALGPLAYYNDGQHLLQRSAERFSRYVAQYLIQSQ